MIINSKSKVVESRINDLNEKLQGCEGKEFTNIEEEVNFWRDFCGCPCKYSCDVITKEDVILLLTSNHYCGNSSLETSVFKDDFSPPKFKFCECNALYTCLGIDYFKLFLYFIIYSKRLSIGKSGNFFLQKLRSVLGK